MKRWLAIGTITVYLGALLLGVASHALNFKAGSHPAMYFVVWDMFCGWSGYESRLHIVGEGESGRFYQLAPGPWGDFHPFGDMSRHSYDPPALHAAAVGMSTLRNTEHEPMQRLYVVEEMWAKKFNLPDGLWAKRYVEPKVPYSYYHLRQILDADGRLVGQNAGWFDAQAQACLADNPRLLRDSHLGKPFYHVSPMQRSTESGVPETASVTLGQSGLAAR